MRALRWAVVGVAAAIAIVGSVLWMRVARDEFMLGGIQVNEADHGHWFEELERAGMNTVATTVYAKQGDWDTDHLWWEDEEEAVVLEIRGAKAHGLKVVLIPRVALDHAFPRNRFLWHGLIMPRTDAMIDSWFERYREFLVKWAEIAQREEVDVFAVGSEMNALASTVALEDLPALQQYYLDTAKQDEKREAYRALGSPETSIEEETSALQAWAGQVAFELGDDALTLLNNRRARLQDSWLATIAAVRRVYGGRLTYAANFDQYREVEFWSALDLIGINAYFPLRTLGDPVPDERALSDVLERGWSEILSEIDTFRTVAGVPTSPVLFTEIGYARRADVTLAPWAGSGMTMIENDDGDRRLVVWDRQPTDLRERALALGALRSANRDRGGGLLCGLLYWKLSTEPAHLEIEPFVHILGAEDDPLGAELRRFRDR